MNHLRFKNLFKVIMITHAMIQRSWYLKNNIYNIYILQLKL